MKIVVSNNTTVVLNIIFTPNKGMVTQSFPPSITVGGSAMFQVSTYLVI